MAFVMLVGPVGEILVNTDDIASVEPIHGGDDWSDGALVAFRSDRSSFQIYSDHAKELIQDLVKG